MRIGLKFVCGCVVLAWVAASGQTASLKPFPASEAADLINRIPKTLLPPHTSHLEVQKKQAFTLVAPGQIDLLLVPVKFWHGEPSEIDVNHMLVERDRCGLFVMPKDGKSSFVWTMDDKTGLAVDLCGEVTAMATMSNEGARPRLIAIYRTYSPPQFEDIAKYVLVWDATKETYAVDKKAFDYLNGGRYMPGSDTVAGVKAALARQGK